MLLDDELYTFWTRFRPDVRVLVISDSCHSGTVIKKLAADAAVAAESPRADKPRFLPLAVAATAYLHDRAFYEALGRNVKGEMRGTMSMEEVASRPLNAPVHCAVRLLSGCQDNQLSRDGLVNGRFTGELLRAWDQGRFSGDYRSFHARIVSRMPASQTPNYWLIGQPSAAFDAQVPFSI
jgi:metacaspase-1